METKRENSDPFDQRPGSEYGGWSLHGLREAVRPVVVMRRRTVKTGNPWSVVKTETKRSGRKAYL